MVLRFEGSISEFGDYGPELRIAASSCEEVLESSEGPEPEETLKHWTDEAQRSRKQGTWPMKLSFGACYPIGLGQRQHKFRMGKCQRVIGNEFALSLTEVCNELGVRA